MLPLGHIFRKCGISFHCYADDMQIDLPLKLKYIGSLAPLLNFLNFNENKTEVMLFTPGGTSESFDLDLGEIKPLVKPYVKTLGVILDCDFKLDKQINSVVKAIFFQLRQLTKVKSFLSPKDFQRILHIFISTLFCIILDYCIIIILDYCNGLYIGISQISGLWNVGPLLFNGCAKLLDIGRNWNAPGLFLLCFCPMCVL